MALRIHQSVIRGEIDNRKRDRVRGSIFLMGRDEPIVLALSGNCLRDLAGCVVRFENPRPVVAEPGGMKLRNYQHGVAGEMTASRKVRVFDVSVEEPLRLTKGGTAPPEHLGSAFYIEWFSEAKGRVVIESTDYKIDISTPDWTLSQAEEHAQIAATLEALRAWLERIDQPERAENDSSDGRSRLDPRCGGPHSSSADEAGVRERNVDVAFLRRARSAWGKW
jgi:hypothetical protein